MTKKYLIAFGVLGALALPTSAMAEYAADTDGDVVDNRQVDENSNVTLDVLAAIELAVPADDSDKVAPLAGGASDANIGFTTSADLRSNLSWAVETSLDTDEMQGGSTGTRALLSEVDLSASADSGNRNSSNAAQTYETAYDQDVSWGDEAGTYDVTATHTASQTLGD